MVLNHLRNAGSAWQGLKVIFGLATAGAAAGSAAYMYRDKIGKAASDLGTKLSDDPFGTIGNAFTSTTDAISNYGKTLDATRAGIDGTVALGQEIKNDPGKAFSKVVGKVTGSDPSKPEEEGGFDLGGLLKWAGIGGGSLLGGKMLWDFIGGGDKGDNNNNNNDGGGFPWMKMIMGLAVVGLVVANFDKIKNFVSNTFNSLTGGPDPKAPSVAQNIGMDPTGRTQVVSPLTYDPAPAY